MSPDSVPLTRSPPVASRIRLAVALAVLKLLASRDAYFMGAVVAKFDLFTRTAQDATFEVREAFLKKLLAYLRRDRFHPGVIPRLNMVLFLVAHEPEEELKEAVLAFARGRRQRLPDSASPSCSRAHLGRPPNTLSPRRS